MEAVSTNNFGFSPDLPVRQEVHEFVRAAEKLLSPALRVSPLTDVECEYIREYLMTMSRAGHPWSRGLPTT